MKNVNNEEWMGRCCTMKYCTLNEYLKNILGFPGSKEKGSTLPSCKEMGLPDLICLLTNLYASQEATARTRHRTKGWFKIGKGVGQGCILSPCLFNLYAEYIMWNVRLDEAQAGIKIAGRNINDHWCADYTTLIAENEEELKNL